MSSAAVAPDLYEPPDAEPHRKLYDSRMVKRVMVGIQEMRLRLRPLVDAVVAGTHVVFTRHGRPVAVLVPIEWYRTAADSVGDPTDIAPYQPPARVEE